MMMRAVSWREALLLLLLLPMPLILQQSGAESVARLASGSGSGGGTGKGIGIGKRGGGGGSSSSEVSKTSKRPAAGHVTTSGAGDDLPPPTLDHSSAAASCSTASYCLSWRAAVEANNARMWRTAPAQCWRYIEGYMVGPSSQYTRDLNFVIGIVNDYLDSISPLLARDGKDAWILDVDDTCLSNLFYYRFRRFGCEPYDPEGFKEWAMRGGCPAIQPVLDLFNTLLDTGFKVFLITGRDNNLLADVTTYNLQIEGFVGYERLILRGEEYRGKSAVIFKSNIRKRLEEEEGYRIWGNVGDQWTDLQGDSVGNRTFKLPNPMYFVP